MFWKIKKAAKTKKVKEKAAKVEKAVKEVPVVESAPQEEYIREEYEYYGEKAKYKKIGE